MLIRGLYVLLPGEAWFARCVENLLHLEVAEAMALFIDIAVLQRHDDCQF